MAPCRRPTLTTISSDALQATHARPTRAERDEGEMRTCRIRNRSSTPGRGHIPRTRSCIHRDGPQTRLWAAPQGGGTKQPATQAAIARWFPLSTAETQGCRMCGRTGPHTSRGRVLSGLGLAVCIHPARQISRSLEDTRDLRCLRPLRGGALAVNSACGMPCIPGPRATTDQCCGGWPHGGCAT